MTEPYSMSDLDLDLSTAEWVDDAIWVEGTTQDGKDVSAGFEPCNLDPTTDASNTETVDDGVTFDGFARLSWLYEVGGDYLEVE